MNLILPLLFLLFVTPVSADSREALLELEVTNGHQATPMLRMTVKLFKHDESFSVQVEGVDPFQEFRSRREARLSSEVSQKILTICESLVWEDSAHQSMYDLSEFLDWDYLVIVSWAGKTKGIPPEAKGYDSLLMSSAFSNDQIRALVKEVVADLESQGMPPERIKRSVWSKIFADGAVGRHPGLSLATSP